MSDDSTPDPWQFPTLTRTQKIMLLCVPLAMAACVLAMASTAALSRLVLGDPGDAVRYGLPLVRVAHDLAAAVTIGLLALAAGVLPGQSRVPGVVSYSQWTAVRWATRAAVVWAAASLSGIVLATANSIGEPLTAPGLANQVWFYVTEVDLGKYLAVSAGLVLVTLATIAGARSVTRVGVGAVLAVAALLPVALSGHAAGSDQHANAVNSLMMHIVSVTTWCGGLAGLVLLRPRVKGALGTVVARYSALAGWCFAVAAFSGVINASLRLHGPADLVTSSYGRLIALKVLALTGLGAAGWMQRRRVIPHLDGPRGARLFARLALAEVVVMSATFGISVALSRSAPPVPQTPDAYDVRRSLLGFPYPPPVSARTMLTQFEPDWLFIAVAVAALVLYLAGVRRLRARGDAWPPGRTVAWVVGCFLLVYATSGGPGVYGSVHFSTHMIGHMALMMYVPLPMVLGAPTLLALRALTPRTDHSRGPREWLLHVLRSRYVYLLSRPAVAGTIFAGSLVAFYYTGWFQFALLEHPGHLLMQVHFLLSGYLFFWVLVGIDPGPKRAPYPIRLIALLTTMVFHAFFGVALMTGNQLLATTWWASLGGATAAQLLADQQRAGAIAWGAGELPVLVAALIVAVQWSRDEERRARRYDRQADRDGDAELRAYNAHLAQLASGRSDGGTGIER